MIRRGRNVVSFFIGPAEAGTLTAAEALDDAQLPWDVEQADAFRLTVVFVPASDEPEPQEAELELPRFGRSEEISFTLDVPPDTEGAAARIIVLFRNRVLQTAVLRGEVGRPAALGALAGFVTKFSGLDDRRAFDVALLTNDTNGDGMVVRRSPASTRVSRGGEIKPIAKRIADVLASAANLPSTNLSSKRSVALLIKLAVEGHDLFDTLEQELGSLRDAERIQVVNASSEFLLPIEAVYAHTAPLSDAKLCSNYLDDPARCTGSCTPDGDTSTLCPNAFWGLSKTIERHRYDPKYDDDPGGGYRLYAVDPPRSGQRDIEIDHAVVGVSDRVKAPDASRLINTLGARGAGARDWNDWKSKLSGADTQLLVLCPHTDAAANTLEISKMTLARGNIEAPYVTGCRPVSPIVVLFGCRTVGTDGDPAGFANRFMQKGARVVFHSSTDLHSLRSASSSGSCSRWPRRRWSATR